MSVLDLMTHFCVNIYITGRDGLSGCALLSTVEVVTTSLLTSIAATNTVYALSLESIRRCFNKLLYGT